MHRSLPNSVLPSLREATRVSFTVILSHSVVVISTGTVVVDCGIECGETVWKGRQ